MNHRATAADIDRRIASLMVLCNCEHPRRYHNGATADNHGGNDCRRCDCPLFISTEVRA